jgi:hypothetical protein
LSLQGDEAPCTKKSILLTVGLQKKAIGYKYEAADRWMGGGGLRLRETDVRD